MANWRGKPPHQCVLPPCRHGLISPPSFPSACRDQDVSVRVAAGRAAARLAAAEHSATTGKGGEGEGGCLCTRHHG